MDSCYATSPGAAWIYSAADVGALNQELHTLQFSSAPQACRRAVVTVAVKVHRFGLVFSELNPDIRSLPKMSAVMSGLCVSGTNMLRIHKLVKYTPTGILPSQE